MFVFEFEVKDIVPTPVGVNRRAADRYGDRRDCPHARGGEPEDDMTTPAEI